MSKLLSIGVCAGTEILRSGIVSCMEGAVGVGEVVVAADVPNVVARAGGTNLVVLVDGRSRLAHLVEALKEWPDGVELPGLVLLAEPGVEQEIVTLLDQGVRGIVSAEASASDLRLAVDVVSRGDYYIHGGFLAQAISAVGGLAVRAWLASTPNAARLTAREFDVLQLLAQGMSNEDIAKKLSVSRRTIKYHVSNLLSKLGARNRWQAVTLIYGTPRAVNLRWDA